MTEISTQVNSVKNQLPPQSQQPVLTVQPAQSLASGHPAFDPHAGTAAVGVGFSATRFLTDHWLLNLDSALSRLKGSPDVSPIPERRTQRVLVLSASYLW